MRGGSFAALMFCGFAANVAIFTATGNGGLGFAAQIAIVAASFIADALCARGR